jgi:hypothetical protein
MVGASAATSIALVLIVALGVGVGAKSLERTFPHKLVIVRTGIPEDSFPIVS